MGALTIFIPQKSFNNQLWCDVPCDASYPWELVWISVVQFQQPNVKTTLVIAIHMLTEANLWK